MRKTRPTPEPRPGSAAARRRGETPRANGAGAPADAGAIEIELDGGALVATLLRPHAQNRISHAMGRELMDLAQTVEDDDSILALAITGAGTAFCAGFEDDVDPQLVETLAILSKPTVAVINGNATDEGLELAMALDLRAATSDARLALTQLVRGQLPRFGGTQRLPRLAGPAHALRMLLTGAPMPADEGLRVGLVTYVAHDREDLDRVTRELLATLVSRGPLGMRMAKEAVCKGYDMTIDQGIRLEEDLYALLQTTSDRAEGVRAFLEKRKPLFKGA
ncbi:MAG TPA: enoyl-CoA hydratase/isomerase family protein [Candidatus Binataceae bacterium]|jgi:enoyl-CoA hydratase|nr:enoyl-CoA hydratase/isomerase family protein [Candidatus Binataceae bacterium]